MVVTEVACALGTPIRRRGPRRRLVSTARHCEASLELASPPIKAARRRLATGGGVTFPQRAPHLDIMIRMEHPYRTTAAGQENVNVCI